MWVREQSASDECLVFYTHKEWERGRWRECVCVCAWMQSEGVCARARIYIRSISCRAVRRRTVRGSSSLTSSLTSTSFETFLSNESFLYQRRRKKIEFPFEWDVRADVEAVLKWWYYIFDILSDKITEKELCFVNLRQLHFASDSYWLSEINWTEIWVKKSTKTIYLNRVLHSYFNLHWLNKPKKTNYLFIVLKTNKLK